MTHVPPVVVVELDETLRDALCELLRDTGYHVIGATVGATAALEALP